MNVVSALAPPAIALLMAILLVATVLLTARPAPGTEDPGDSDGNGRRPRKPPPRSPRPGGGGDPDWWPDFERAFAVYVRDQAVPLRA